RRHRLAARDGARRRHPGRRGDPRARRLLRRPAAAVIPTRTRTHRRPPCGLASPAECRKDDAAMRGCAPVIPPSAPLARRAIAWHLLGASAWFALAVLANVLVVRYPDIGPF